MALVSPGVEVTIIDQSQYIPAATNSVPYILLATASNKISGTGTGVAAGTLKVNANKVYLISSQRDLAATYGVPFFYKTTTGTPINGYELNEYGLLAAYSALGITNRCYVQRVDIDLAELTATLIRPTGTPNNGVYWLDTANSHWGIFQWNSVTGFPAIPATPLVITNADQLDMGVPLQSIGTIGTYAVNALSVYNPIYFKRGGPTTDQTSDSDLGNLYNTWVLVGSDDWKTSWATIQGTLAPTSLSNTSTIIINGETVGPGFTTVTTLQAAINSAGITGVYAANIGGKLSIYADSTATSDGSTGGEGAVYITNGVGTPLASLGITSSDINGTYLAPALLTAPGYQNPRWGSGQPAPEPTGSVWIKTTANNSGVYLVVKQYSSTLGVFVQQNCPVYETDGEANYALDPSGGGKSIPAGSTYALAQPTPKDPGAPATAGFQILERYSTGVTLITGDQTFTSSDTPFTPGDTIYISATEPGTGAFTESIGAVIGGTGTVADFVNAVLGADVPNVSAGVTSAGNIYFEHGKGGTIQLGYNAPVITAGFNTSVRGVRESTNTNFILLSNWVSTPTFTYTASDTAPDQDPADGRLWYYSDATTGSADIMIQNNGAWIGYQNCANDIRGDDLSLTNATGPIFSTSAPTTQTDESSSPLQYGDLWIDTSDLENYPMISRWSVVNGVDQWVQLDNTDQTTSNGILFADARWAPNGTTNPITDPIPPVATGTTPLITSDYLDLDAPSPDLYPQGMLLWNTRRSGFNVKSFQVDYFNSTSFPDSVLPEQTNAWVTASGNRNDGSPYMGRQSQRALIVQALKAGIDTSVQIREENNGFNLIACPQYPELAPNMVALNDERGNTAFAVVDTPLRLTPEEVVTWSTNNNGLGLATNDGLLVGDAYAGAFYPSCQTTDLSGSPVVQPPSHMMVRTIIRSDEVAYPWLAPAGVRRGVVDNAVQIGYIDAITGEFVTLGVNQGLRDVLYTNRVNPITFIPGVGITNFGNKTTTSSVTALDRINVARLVAFLRGRLSQIAKQYLFEPNDQITRQSITAACTGLMIDLVAKRGIYDYLVVCDLSNNTPTTIDRNELYVDIAIEPVKAVEFIYIPVRILNTGGIASITTV
jgi:hypothetical protein